MGLHHTHTQTHALTHTNTYTERKREIIKKKQLPHGRHGPAGAGSKAVTDKMGAPSRTQELQMGHQTGVMLF